MLRLAFFGTPDFAVPILQACAEVGELQVVLTQPDRPRGRGQKLAASPVKEAALKMGVPVWQPEKLRGSTIAQELKALNLDVAVVAAYGKILPRDVLEAPRLGCLNIHGSLLPRFRGAAPIQWAIASGDAKSGACLMKMDEGLDTGPVVACLEVELAKDETSGSLHEKLSVKGAQLVRDFLPAYAEGKLQARAQAEEGVVHAPMLEKGAGLLDFGRPAVELERKIRAFHPWPSAFTFLEGKLLKIIRGAPAEGKGAPGEILSSGPRGFEVACGEGSLWVEEVQPEGKKPMRAGDFLRGKPLAPGSHPFGEKP